MYSRNKQREIVLQALYMFDINSSFSLESALEFNWISNIEDDPVLFAKELLRNIINNIKQIDSYYNYYLGEGFKKKQLLRIDKAIFRLAVGEHLFLFTDAKIIIDECIKLAKKYSSEESYKLINGVLHNAILEVKKEI